MVGHTGLFASCRYLRCCDVRRGSPRTRRVSRNTCLTNQWIRPLRQARLLRRSRRAILRADQFNVMRTEIVVRIALPSDAEQVANVLIESRKANLHFAPSAHTDEETRVWVATRLLPFENVLVVVADGRIVGIASTTSSAEMSWISQMYVAPGYVGQGIGSLLLERSLKRLSRPVRLYTFQQNIGARRFYERNGFVAISLSDGSDNEEHCPSVLYELPAESKVAHNQSSDPVLSSGTPRAGHESRHR